jgi:hypothetical protein
MASTTATALNKIKSFLVSSDRVPLPTDTTASEHTKIEEAINQISLEGGEDIEPPVAFQDNIEILPPPDDFNDTLLADSLTIPNIQSYNGLLDMINTTDEGATIGEQIAVKSNYHFNYMLKFYLYVRLLILFKNKHGPKNKDHVPALAIPKINLFLTGNKNSERPFIQHGTSSVEAEPFYVTYKREVSNASNSGTQPNALTNTAFSGGSRSKRRKRKGAKSATKAKRGGGSRSTRKNQRRTRKTRNSYKKRKTRRVKK